jgi:hypothetical protein
MHQPRIRHGRRTGDQHRRACRSSLLSPAKPDRLRSRPVAVGDAAAAAFLGSPPSRAVRAGKRPNDQYRHLLAALVEWQPGTRTGPATCPRWQVWSCRRLPLVRRDGWRRKHAATEDKAGSTQLNLMVAEFALGRLNRS